MFLRFWNWLIGYLTIEIIGESTEQFMNLCASYKKDVWGFERTSNGVVMRVKLSEWKCLRSFAKRAGVRIKIKRKTGFYFLVCPLFHRWGLLMGAIVFWVVLSILSGRIWLFEVHGVTPGEEKEVLAILEQEGVGVGARSKTFDWATVRQTVLSKNPQISWMALNPQGSLLSVDISKTTNPPTMLSNQEPCNLTATRDGTIVELQVNTGKAVVKVGEAVVKGDLLISGAVEYSNGCTVFTHASGRVMAQTKYQHEVFIPYEQKITRRIGEVTQKCVLSCFGVEIPLYLGSMPAPYEKTIEENFLKIKNTLLPLSLKKASFYPTICETVTVTKEIAQNQGKKEIQQYIQDNLQQAKIENVEYSYRVEEKGVWVKGDIFCVENIIFCEKLLIF